MQAAVPISPGQKVNWSKTLFNTDFKKEPWHLHPSIIPYLTPMDVREARVDEKTKDETVQKGLLIMTAPVNHNKLNKNKTIQILFTIGQRIPG